jgi:hypothetical protein
MPSGSISESKRFKRITYVRGRGKPIYLVKKILLSRKFFVGSPIMKEKSITKALYLVKL